MNINDLKQERAAKIEAMNSILNVAEAEKRNRNEQEVEQWNGLETEVRALSTEIETLEKQEELNKKIIINTNKEVRKNMSILEKLKENRSGNVFNFNIETRSIDTTTGLYNESLYNEIYSTGEKPLVEKMGIKILSNLEGNVKLPKVAGMFAGKVAPGTASNNDKALGFVDLIPNESFRISETISVDMAKNDALVSGLIAEMIKGVDRKISQEVFTVALASAVEQTGVTSVTVANTFAMENLIDGDNLAYLASKEAFATGRALAVETGSGIKLFKKIGANQGETFESTPLFFSPSISKQLVFGDMDSLVLGDWGQVEVGYEFKPSLGQVIITVSKKAAVAYRGVSSLVKTKIA